MPLIEWLQLAPKYYIELKAPSSFLAIYKYVNNLPQKCFNKVIKLFKIIFPYDTSQLGSLWKKNLKILVTEHKSVGWSRRN